MVFSSIPAYLDPANWQQANTNQQTGGSTSSSSHQLPLSSSPAPPPLPAPVQASHGAGLGSIRPGSMADRARMSNIPMPETALKCPRCESTNTKFCYFNNYNLTQPRHFCKTCRRYWTRGGALRTVPVGGGCRRNKRSKSSSSSSGGASSSKSPAAVGTGSIPSNTNSCGPSGASSSSSSSSSSSALLGLNPQIHPLRFMAPPSQLGEFTHGVDIGLHYGGMSSHLNHDMNSFSLGGGRSTFLPPAEATGVEPWRFQPQISSFAGLEGPGTGMFPLHGNLLEARPKLSMSGIIDQMGRGGTSSVKMEESHHQGLNLSRQFMGMQGNDNHHHQQQYLTNWGSGNAAGSTSSWTDLSGFSSSSTTSNPL